MVIIFDINLLQCLYKNVDFFPDARWPPTRFIEADRHFFKRDKLHLSKCIQMYSTDESRLTFRYIESIVSSVMEFLWVKIWPKFKDKGVLFKKDNVVHQISSNLVFMKKYHQRHSRKDFIS